jgi:hypothetical protein
MRLVTGLLLCLVTLTAACGGNGEPPAAKNVETKAAGPETPAGFTVRVVRDEGFSIALPKAWRSVDAQQVLSGGLKEFRKANPQLGGELEALARPNSPIKLVAVDPKLEGGFATNLNVLVTPIPSGIEFDEWTSVQVAEIKKIATVKGLKRDETQLRPGRALHLTYRVSFKRPSGSFVAFVHQYMVKNDGLLYVLTYSTRPSSEPKYRQTFADSARSFRLTG